MKRNLASIAAGLVAAVLCCAGVAQAGESFKLGPPKTGGPVIVRVNFHLLDLNDVDEESETFAFSGALTLSWRDERLAFEPAEVGTDEKIYQGAYQFDEVFDGWYPQFVLANEAERFEIVGVLLRVKSDGTLTLTQTLNASAECDYDLRHYPFDSQQPEAIFEVLGFDDSEVRLELDPATSGVSTSPDAPILVPQWTVTGVRASIRARHAAYAGAKGVASVFALATDLERQPFFMLRLVVIPLILIVMLSWSVFWMDRSSLGDRLSVSFIGILTAVAYQMAVSQILPQISYVTVMNAILSMSFLLMCASTVVNLRVGWLDQHGSKSLGDLIDSRSRWIFPLVYFGLILLLIVAGDVILAGL